MKHSKILVSLSLCFVVLFTGLTACGTETSPEIQNEFATGWWNMPSEYVGVRSGSQREGVAEKTYYVSPTGIDIAAGTKEAPFQTVDRAKLAAREALAAGTDFIDVILRGGEYRLDETLVLNKEDGSEDGRVTYKSYPGEEVRINSDEAIADDTWRKFDAASDSGDVPDAVREHVWVAEIEAFKNTDNLIRTLYKGRHMLKRSSSPGFFPNNESGKEHSLHDLSNPWKYNTLQYPDGVMEDWHNLKDVELRIITSGAFSEFIIPFERVDTAKKEAILAFSALYIIAKPYSPNTPSVESAFIENALAYISEEGNWAVDSTSGKVYYYSSEAPTDIRYPKLQELVRLEGDVDFNGPIDSPVKNVTFDGIVFEHGERYDLPKDFDKTCLQHGWELYDTDTAMFRTRAAEGIVVRNCRFENSGGTGFRADLHFKNSTVTGNEFSGLGSTGILISGYGPGTKDVSKYNEISNNYVHNIGTRYGSALGIYVTQSGYNLISENLLTDLPYTAIAVASRTLPKSREGYGLIRNEYDSSMPNTIYLHGRNNIVQYNEITDVTKRVADGNAVYVSGTGLKNIVRYNYVHDVYSPYFCEVLRCDDLQNGTAFYNNVMSRFGGYGDAICVKGSNDAVNNIIHIPATLEEPKYGIFSAQGREDLTGAQIKNNIMYVHNNIYDAYEMHMYPSSLVQSSLSQADVDNNLYWCTTDSAWGSIVLAENEMEFADLNGYAQDPMFYDSDNEDYRFLPTSVCKGTFEELDLSKVGLRADFPFVNADDEIRALFVNLNGEFSLGRLNKSDKNGKLTLSARSKKGYLYSVDSKTLNYRTNDSSISVSEDGTVRANKKGRFEITISLKNNPEIKTKLWVDIV